MLYLLLFMPKPMQKKNRRGIVPRLYRHVWAPSQSQVQRQPWWVPALKTNFNHEMKKKIDSWKYGQWKPEANHLHLQTSPLRSAPPRTHAHTHMVHRCADDEISVPVSPGSWICIVQSQCESGVFGVWILLLRLLWGRRGANDLDKSVKVSRRSAQGYRKPHCTNTSTSGVILG